MKRRLLIMGFVLSASCPVLAKELCSKEISFCQVRKVSYQENRWVAEYSKEMKLKNLCFGVSDPSHGLMLEPELGVAVEVLPENKTLENPIEKESTLNVDLFSYKRTFVIASSSVPIDAKGIQFKHRLTPTGNSLIEITCH